MSEVHPSGESTQPTSGDIEEDDAERIECAFCGASQRECKSLIAGPSCYICDACVTLAQGAIADGVLRRKWEYDSTELAKAKVKLVELTTERNAALERVGSVRLLMQQAEVLLESAAAIIEDDVWEPSPAASAMRSHAKQLKAATERKEDGS